MSDYEVDLERFMNAWEQVQLDMQAQERVQELADRQGMKIEEVQAILNRIDEGLRRLHSKNRPSRAELVDRLLHTDSGSN
jgi:hypothetical protein